ncbi:glutamate--tRNA ligase family protein [Campylobacter rectus]
MNQKIISRIAPTPSGFLHAGNIYNFLLTYLFTRAFDGILHLRIDDYDLSRYRRQYVENIFRVLDMLGVDFDGGPGGVGEFETKFSSKFRLDAYKNTLKKLEQNGVCYACECSHSMKNSFKNGIYMRVCADKNLKFKKNETAMRLRVPDDLQINARQNLINFDVLRGGDTVFGLENRANFDSVKQAKFGDEKLNVADMRNASENVLNSANLGSFSGEICVEQNLLKFNDEKFSETDKKGVVKDVSFGEESGLGEQNSEGLGGKIYPNAANLKAAGAKSDGKNSDASLAGNEKKICLKLVNLSGTGCDKISKNALKSSFLNGDKICKANANKFSERVSCENDGERGASSLTDELRKIAYEMQSKTIGEAKQFGSARCDSNLAGEAMFEPFETEKFAQSQSVNLAQILGDFVVWKKDDTPAYNLASLVDDEILGINLLVRGEDLLACSAAQKYAAQILGYDFAGANFIHHGLLSYEGKKLSKSSRAPAVSVTDGAKIHYKFAALKLGLDASKCDTLSNLLEMFRGKFKI